MWVRALLVAFGLALGIGLCVYVAVRISKLGGRGAVGTALRWGLFPFAVFLLSLPLLAMHGLLRAIAGMTILMSDLCVMAFLAGLVIGLWKEAARYRGPFVLDPTIALNRPVKKFFSILLFISLFAAAPWLASLSLSLVVADLSDLALNFPEFAAWLEAISAKTAPCGAAGLAMAAVSFSLSLGWDWTLGGVIESALTALAKRR